MAEIIQHSPTALSHYRQQLSLSRDFLANKSGIAVSKIEKGETDSHVFTFRQIQILAKRLLIPEFYLLTDHIAQSVIPAAIDHRNFHGIIDENTDYQSQKVLHELVKNRENLIYTYESLDVWVDKFSLNLTGENAVADADRIRDWLLVNDAKFKTENNDDYYRSWRTLIEKKDVIIIELSGIKIGSEGMALHYDILPIIAILSSGQSHSRRLFTMIHELVHLGLRQSAIDGNILANNSHIERYCNQVAGHVLLPQAVADELFDPTLALEDNIKNIRQSIKVSKQAIAIQLKLLGLISHQDLNDYIDTLEEKKDDTSGFGIPKKTQMYNQFGKVYLQQVISAVWHNAIPIHTALKMLHLTTTQELTDLEKKVFS